MKRQSLPLLMLAFLALAACGGYEAPTAESPPDNAPSVAGSWRAVLASPGGELPFLLRISGEGGELEAAAINGGEEDPFSSVEQDGQQVVMRFDWYDSEITAELDSTGDRMSGRWRKTVPAGNSVLAFTATRSDGAVQRFGEEALEPGSADAPAEIAGHWSATFQDEGGSEPARVELRQSGSEMEGTILTPTGDYRFLEGTYEAGLMRLSTFDGAHAFLFHARVQDDGTLAGDFWSRDTYHATWTAERLEDESEQVLPDAWSLAGLTNDEGRFSFRFPDLEGNEVSLEDPRFADKVVLVNIFGSWCPNCNDEAPLLAEWAKRYRDQGFEIVGLAYEFSGDPERDRIFVRKFAERYGIDYPLLLAGVSDKAKASETLPDLSRVVAFPTSIFIGRDGKVRKIHTAFTGPGTGDHYTELVGELEGLIEELLAEGQPS